MHDELPIRIVALNENGDEVQTVLKTSNQLAGRAAFESFVKQRPRERWMLLQLARIMARHNCE